MEKLINRMINDAVEGVDTYKTDGSTWLIFTETKKWVIELTKDGTLWYNYNFFKDLLIYLSMDVVENQHYITKWVEDTIINGAISTKGEYYKQIQEVEDTIQNGIKETKTPGEDGDILGVLAFLSDNNTTNIPYLINDIIQNGVKHTEKSLQIDGSCVVEDVIQNGIKETHDDVYHNKGRIDGVIRNGVKEIKPSYRMIYNPMNFQPEIIEDKRLPDITDVICDGIKEVQPLPAQDGNRDWGNYYYRKGEPTKPHTKYVDEVIESGIKETKLIDYSDNTEFIVNGVISRGISI